MKFYSINALYPRIWVTYNRTSYLNAWKTSIDNYYSTFSNLKILLPAPVDHICFADNDGAAFYQDVFNYAISKTSNPTNKFLHYATDLKSTGVTGSSRLDKISVNPTNLLRSALVGLQYTWSYTDDNGVKLGGNLMQATCDKGIKSLNGHYFEVYKVDIDSADTTTQSAVHAIHNPWECM